MNYKYTFPIQNVELLGIFLSQLKHILNQYLTEFTSKLAF